MFELFYSEFPISDDTFHQVANRYHPDEMFVTKDRKVSDAFFGHDCHTGFGGLFGPHADDICFHNLAD